MNLNKYFNFNYLFLFFILFILMYIKGFYNLLGFDIGYIGIVFVLIFDVLILGIGIFIKSKIAKQLFTIFFVLLNLGFLYNYTTFHNPMMVFTKTKYKKEVNKKETVVEGYIDCGTYLTDVKNNYEIKDECVDKHFKNKKNLSLIRNNETLKNNLSKTKFEPIIIYGTQFYSLMKLQILFLILGISLVYLYKSQKYKLIFFKLTKININDFISRINDNNLFSKIENNINTILIVNNITTIFIALLSKYFHVIHYFLFYCLINITILPWLLKKHSQFPRFIDSKIVHVYVSLLVSFISLVFLYSLNSEGKFFSNLFNAILKSINFMIEFDFNGSSLKSILLFIFIAFIIYLFSSIFITLAIISKLLFKNLRKRELKFYKELFSLVKSNMNKKSLIMIARREINPKESLSLEFIKKFAAYINSQNIVTVFLIFTFIIPPVATLDGGVALFNILLTTSVMIYLFRFDLRSSFYFIYSSFITLLFTFFVISINSEKLIYLRVKHFLEINKIISYDTNKYSSYISFISDTHNNINYDTYYIGYFVYNGGFWGNGFGNGFSEILSNVNKDYVYSSLANQVGFFACIFTILLICLYSIICTSFAEKTKNIYFKAVAISSSGLILIPAFISIGGNLKFLPFTGIPLIPIAFSNISSLLFIFFSILLIFIIDFEEGKSNENIITKIEV